MATEQEVVTFASQSNLSKNHDHCCVPKCVSDRRKPPAGRELLFHHFPTRDDVVKKWIVAIRRDVGDRFRVTKNTVVCSDHFEDNDYARGLKQKGARLRGDAVPSIFDLPGWPKTRVKRPPPTDRSEPAPKRVHARVPTLEEAYEARCGEATELSKALEDARKNIEDLEGQVFKATSFNLARFKSSPAKMTYYTGFANYAMFRACADFLKLYDEGSVLSKRTMAPDADTRHRRSGAGRKDTFTLEEQFFLTLVRLRRGVDEEMLADLDGTSQPTVSRILQKMINYLYLRLGMIPIWPTVEDVASNLPAAFRDLYPSTFLVMDCTELRCEVPSSLPLQSQLYSSYKEHTTLKSLLAMTPDGAMAFVSQLFGGSISDRELVQRSGFADMLKTAGKGSSLMADKGFDVQDLFVDSGVKVNIPPFLQKGSQFSEEDVQRTQQIAKVRIHVERLISRVKDFNIFARTVPVTLFPVVNQAWTICCLLTLFQTPVLQHGTSKQCDTSTADDGEEQREASTAGGNAKQPGTSTADGGREERKTSTAGSIAKQHGTSSAEDGGEQGEACTEGVNAKQHSTSTADDGGEQRDTSTADNDDMSAAGGQREKCFVCRRSDGPCILRTCKECGGRYHHFCQLDDEEGHFCNMCFQYM